MGIFPIIRHVGKCAALRNGSSGFQSSWIWVVIAADIEKLHPLQGWAKNPAAKPGFQKPAPDIPRR